MRKAVVLAFAGVMAVFAVLALSYLTKSREVITSTPSDYTGLTAPLPIPAHGEACADQILFDTDSEVARFGVAPPKGAEADALEVAARGVTSGPYRSEYESTARIPGGWRGTRTFDVPLTPPKKAVFGTFCVRNRGETTMNLVGSLDGRAYSRPTVYVNGQPTGTELQLRLLERDRKSILSRLGQVTRHAATLKPFGAWWIWLLAIALLTLAPLALLAAIRSALALDG